MRGFENKTDFVAGGGEVEGVSTAGQFVAANDGLHCGERVRSETEVTPAGRSVHDQFVNRLRRGRLTEHDVKHLEVVFQVV